jgi:hypothetical protein
VWRLRGPVTGRLQSCELRDDSKVRRGLGCTNVAGRDDEPLFSRRCVDERGTRYVAQAFKQDTLRAGGWKRRSNEESYSFFQAISSVPESITGCSCSAGLSSARFNKSVNACTLGSFAKIR